jgi:M6 family metalloprotease-like protein
MRKLFTLVFLYIIVSESVSAAFLRNVPVVVRQPDGSQLNAFISGDEFARRLHDEKDYTIIQHLETGFYVYAIQQDKGLIPSDCIAGYCDPSVLGILPGADLSPSAPEENRPMHLKSLFWPVVNPSRGNVSNIVISIRFRDQAATTFTSADYEKLFNDQEELSLKSYYQEVSGQQLILSSHFLPRSADGIILEYADTHPRSYYSPYHEINNPGGYVSNGWITRQQTLLENAVKWAGADIIASGQDFDVNKDGFIDNIMFVFQGAGDAWGDILWPSSGFMFEPLTIGDKKVGTFNKLLSEMMGPEVSCHEFFHSLGAPDLYRYYNRDIDPAGAWDIMGYSVGQQMSVYMKWRYGRWLDKLPEATQSGTYSLLPVSKNPFHAWKIPSPAGIAEYFVAEYRQKEGVSDSNLPQDYEDGLIIYRVDTRTNWGNAYGPPDELYVFRYGGDSVLNGMVNHAALSAESGRTLLNAETNPALVMSNRTPALIEISQVSYSGDSVSFRLNFLNPLSAAENFKATVENGEIHFTWNKPAGKQMNKGYNLYKKGTQIPINNALITDTVFKTPLPGNDLFYSYELRAVYLQGESEAVSAYAINTKDPAVLDSLALVILYRECNGDNWTNKTNWLKGPVSSWQGVVLSGGRVSELSITGSISKKSGLTGRIPAETGNLTGLKILRLNNNQLTGPIPKEFGKLILLEDLQFYDTQLSGEIPAETASLVNLRNIDLRLSNFTGIIPEGIRKLDKLEHLLLSRNKINGKLPEDLWGLSRLQSLDLEGNQLTGSISSGIGSLNALKILNLGQNRFSGTIPEGINRLSSLEEINLSGNDLSGEILPLITSLNKLRIIRLENNRFSGTIPKTIAGLRQLEELVLSGNQFSGELPGELGWLSYLSGNLWLDNNRFSGNVPEGLSGLRLIRSIKLENNLFEHIPDFTGLTSLERLSVDNNRLTFEDLESNMDIIFKPGGYGISYSRQAKIGTPETKYAPPGKALELSVYCGGNSNEYQWFKNGIPVTGKEKDPVLLLPEIEKGDNGSYFCRITNLKVHGLVIESHPVRITGENILIANAGHDRAADEGTKAELDGTASYNPYSGSTLYRWTAPEGIVLNDENSPKPTFTTPDVDYDKRLTFRLTISNGTLSSDPDEVIVTIRNTGSPVQADRPPIAIPGFNRIYNAGARVILDGSASFDPEGQPVTFSWEAPSGILLASDTVVAPSFLAPEVKMPVDLVFTLTVSDGKLLSEPAEVKITIYPVFRVTEFVSLCDGQVYNGLTNPGTYERKLVSVAGYDSIVTTNLTVNKVYYSDEYIRICRGENYLGWHLAGKYQRTFETALGCDSTLTTYLDFYPVQVPVIKISGDTLNATGIYAAYQWYKNTSPVLEGTESQYIISGSGTYHLVVSNENGCRDTSEVFNLIYSGADIELNRKSGYTLYPNPASRSFVFIPGILMHDAVTLILTEITGRVLETRHIRSQSALQEERFEVSDLAPGLYLLIVSSKDYRETVKILVNSSNTGRLPNRTQD